MRDAKYLRERYRILLAHVGLTLCLVGIIVFSPVLCALFYPEERAVIPAFALTGLFLVIVGWAGWRRLPLEVAYVLTYRDAAIVVLLIWMIAVLLGAVPFCIVLGLNFSCAVFESVSGWTTTGLSVVDVAACPRTVLFYRSVLQFAGGAGFAVMMLAAMTGPVGTALLTAEGRETQLVPNVKRSAKLVFMMYGIYTLAGVIALRIAGMGGFDAVNHAFTAVSTGGFSTRPGSVAYWNNSAVEWVVIVLMLLGATNFVTSYLLFRGKFRAYLRNGETRLEWCLLSIGLALIFFLVTQNLYGQLSKDLRVTVFETVSAFSTTGFSTASYTDWKNPGWMVLIALMVIGAATGSTGGGIKRGRIYLLYRVALWEVRRRILPESAVSAPNLWRAEERAFISDEDFRLSGVFVFIYIGMLFTGSLVIASHGFPLRDSLFEFASALGTVGLSSGITSANLQPVLLWTQILGMFFGRLEIFVVLVGSMRLLRDMRRMLPGI